MNFDQIGLLLSIILSIVLPTIGVFVSYKVFKALLEYRISQAEKDLNAYHEWKRIHEKEHSENAIKSEARWGKIEGSLSTLLERSKKWEM